MKKQKKENVNKKSVFIIIGIFLIVSLIACITYIIFDKLIIEKELYKNIDNYLESSLSYYEDKDNDDYIQVILNDKTRIIQKQGNDYQEIYTKEDDGRYIGTYKDRLYFSGEDDVYYREINNNSKKHYIIQKEKDFFDSKLNLHLIRSPQYEFIANNKLYITLDYYKDTEHTVEDLYSLNLDDFQLEKELSNVDVDIYDKSFLNNDNSKLFYVKGNVYMYDLIKHQNNLILTMGERNLINFSYIDGYIAYVDYGEEDINYDEPSTTLSLNLYNIITKEKTKVANIKERENENGYEHFPLYNLIDGKYLYYESDEKICKYSIYAKKLEECYSIPDGVGLFYVVDDKIVFNFSIGEHGWSWPVIDLDEEIEYHKKASISYNDKIYAIADKNFKTNINLLDGSVYTFNGPIKIERNWLFLGLNW